MKKIYNQPQIQVAPMMTQSIICASITMGDPINTSGDPIGGD